jgi:hypothetical protein
MCTVDLLAVVLLALSWSFVKQTSLMSPVFARVLKIGAGAALFLSFAGAATFIVVDSPRALLLRLRNEPLSVDPSLTLLGEGAVGEERVLTITLTNYGERPVRVVGGTSSCSCFATRDLPLDIEPGASCPVSIVASFGKRPGAFEQRFVFRYADGGEQRLVTAFFAGRVIVRKDGS